MNDSTSFYAAFERMNYYTASLARVGALPKTTEKQKPLPTGLLGEPPPDSGGGFSSLFSLITGKTKRQCQQELAKLDSELKAMENFFQLHEPPVKQHVNVLR